MHHILVMYDHCGRHVSSRHVRITGDNLKAEEYAVSRKSCELYRDAAHKLGKWPHRSGEARKATDEAARPAAKHPAREWLTGVLVSIGAALALCVLAYGLSLH